VSGPLQNCRVVDLSRVLAGPWATQLLADYGADVIKVERPDCGDDTRHWGPPWLRDQDGNDTSDSAYFLSTNRNKRSITIDLSHAAGQQIVRELVATADVLIENFKVGTLSRYALDYATLKAINPRLVYCSISAYGQSGSKSAEPGYDAMMQACAGLMSLTGEPESSGGKPQKVGVAIADIMAGMYAATAILASLNRRGEGGEGGEGEYIDVPLYDSQVAWLANQNMNYLISGTAPQRYGTGHPNIVPYQAFETADGNIMISVGNERQFAAFSDCIGRPDLAQHPHYSSNKQRVAHRDALVELISTILRQRSSTEWLGAFSAQQVPAGEVRNLQQVFDDPHTAERNILRQVDHAVAGPVPTVANPVRFSRGLPDTATAPPVLGQHTREVLAEELGYSPEKIQSLVDSGAI
jgi:crotonobetainyl-CoA:carnitine CoA-transferase CaiB-like acyl-CoA transferase